MRYKDYRAFKQPIVFRTFAEAIAYQRTQLIVLVVLFVAGLVVSLASSSFAGAIMMTGAGVSLLGTLVGAKYQD